MLTTTGQGENGGAVNCTWRTSTGFLLSSELRVSGIRTRGVCGKVARTEKFGQRLLNRSKASRLVTYSV